jgi:hypothetical protein
MSILQTLTITESQEVVITNSYSKYISFSIYGTGAGNSIPTGLSYTLKTAIDPSGTLMMDSIYFEYTEQSQSIIQNCGKFAIQTIGTFNPGDQIIIEYVQHY